MNGDGVRKKAKLDDDTAFKGGSDCLLHKFDVYIYQFRAYRLHVQLPNVSEERRLHRVDQVSQRVRGRGLKNTGGQETTREVSITQSHLA
jgi:hypothetical protein